MKGLVRTNLMKNGENVSKYLEDLLVAEKKAIDGKQGLHSKKAAPELFSFADIVHNSKRAKDYEVMFAKKQGTVYQGVIEYCFSGMRFKVRLNTEGVCIGFNLFGVKTMADDKNQPLLKEYSDDAKKFSNDLLFQRDVGVEICFADKRGSFFGYLTMPNKSNFATKLVEAGLAQVSYMK